MDELLLAEPPVEVGAEVVSVEVEVIRGVIDDTRREPYLLADDAVFGLAGGGLRDLVDRQGVDTGGAVAGVEVPAAEGDLALDVVAIGLAELRGVGVRGGGGLEG